MAKRTIQECDLTKQEIPEGDEIVSITIKRAGKKSGRTYEISSAAAAKLEQQLVAGTEATLFADWNFHSSVRKIVEPSISGKKLADLDNDEAFVAQKKSELENSGRLEEPVIQAVADASCRHLNKGRIQTTLRDGKRFAYRICTLCRTSIPEKTKAERVDYMNGELPADVSVRDYNPS